MWVATNIGVRFLFASPVQLLPASLCPHDLDSQGGFLDKSEPKHSGTAHRVTRRSGNPDTPEWNPAETGDGRTRTPRNGTPRKRSVPESGHGESGPGLRARRFCCSCSHTGLEASPGSTPSGAALSARGEGTSLAARWRDTGDTPTPRVQVLPEKSFGLGSAPPSPELPTSLAASIQDSDFLRLFHASFLSSH